MIVAEAMIKSISTMVFNERNVWAHRYLLFHRRECRAHPRMKCENVRMEKLKSCDHVVRAHSCGGQQFGRVGLLEDSAHG
jgi:hypothetical protein